MAVAESDVFVVHVIDLNEFIGRSKGRAQLTGYERHDGAYGLIGEIEGESYPLSPALVNDVLFAFETIDSAANSMLSLIEAVDGMEPSTREEPSSGADADAIVNNRDEAIELAADASARERYDVVSMPRELYEELLRQVAQRGTQKPDEPEDP